ncbi:MAG: hypothetical protein QOF21_2639 [Actinomycetota bacterium]
MGGRLRSNARRFFFASAAVCLVLAAFVPSADAEDTIPPPEVFSGNASAQAISVELNRDALLPVPELFKFIALDGASAYSSSNRQARASLLFPGNGLILGPSLACGTFGGQFPPEFKPILDQCLQYNYPLTVFADDFRPDGATAGALTVGRAGDTISGNFTGARAHAGEDMTTTDAAVQDLQLLGLPPFGPVAVPIPIPGFAFDTSLATVDSATSRTDQRIVNGSLVTVAKTTMSGVHLVGGLIDIGALTSVSKITDDGRGTRTADATLVTSGVTVAGQPARFTNKGLELGPSKQGVPVSLDQANTLLNALGVKVTTLPTVESVNQKGAAVASVGGVLIEFARDVQGLPTAPGIPQTPVGELDPNGLYTGSIQLGATGVLGQAASFGLDSLDDTGDAIGGIDLGYSPDDFGGSFDDGSLIPSTALGSSTSKGTGASRPSLVRNVVDDFGDRIGLVYLAIVFAVLGLCIAPRLAIPARLPGPRS